MTMSRMLAGAAALGALAAPAAAQYYPQQNYPQQYQQQYQQPYQQYQQPYQQPYQQAYPGYGNQGTGNVVTDIIDQLLGNRYNVSDRQAVRQCANAARAQASQQYGGYNRGGMRVTSITEVQRRGNGLRVSGTMSSGGGYAGNGYGNGYGYQNRGYENVSFRCNVAYNGAVTGIRIGSRRY